MAEPFKNLFNKEITEKFSDLILSEYKGFEKELFIKKVFDNQFEFLELKQRMDYITKILNEFLFDSYEKNIELLKKVTKEETGFFYMILPHYVELYGLDNFNVSIEALKTFTKLCSSEFAVRPFIIKYEEKMLEEMEKWSKSDNDHIRRLASEGSRPILPWGKDIPFLRKNPNYLTRILDNLMEDNSEYVKKSVANNLNSISKDNPQFVLDYCKNWINKNKSIDKIIKHGLRTLLKEGNKEALKLIGYSDQHYEIKDFLIDTEVKIGENLNFSFELFSNETLGKIRIEYFIHLLRQKEKYNKKIFKLSEVIDNNHSKKITKKHSFKKVTTRNYYQGKHFVTIVVNGKELETKEFFLKENS